MCVLGEKKMSGGIISFDSSARSCQKLFAYSNALRSLTLRMRRMAAIPDVAMTLALLGTRFSRVGMTLSAAWSNLLPRIDDKCLAERKKWLQCKKLSKTN